MTSLLYLIGIWHRGDKPTVKEMRVKWFYCIFYVLLVVSLITGALKTHNINESIFLAESSINSVILATKLWILIWKQNEILDLLNRVCVFSIRHNDDHKRFERRLQGLMKFVFVFLIAVTGVGFLVTVGLTFLGNERVLFMEIGFPLDYRKSEIAFWCAFTFLSFGIFVTVIVVIFTVIIWYLLFVCALRYEVLGSELKVMGQISEISDDATGKMTEWQAYKNYYDDLTSSIDAHVHLRE